MASAYSIARTYNEFIPPVDLEFMANAMEMKQNQYDANYAAVQGQLDFIANLDILKGEDKQYLVERTKALVEDINLSGKIDISNNAVTKQLQSHIKQALDNNVMNAVSSTAKYRKFKSSLEELKQNNPDQYSVENELYSLRPFQNYLMDGKVGSVLGELSYTPYTDLQKKFNEYVNEMNESYGDRVVEVPKIGADGERYIEKRTWRGLSQNEIRSVFENSLSPQDTKQLQINGWYRFGLATPEIAEKKYFEFRDAEIAEADGNIALYKEYLKNTTDPETKAKIESEIVSLEASKKRVRSYEQYSKNPEVIAELMERENLIGGLVAKYSEKERKRELETNAAYYSQKGLEIDLADLQIKQKNFELEQDKFEYTKQKDALDRELEAAKAAAAGKTKENTIVLEQTGVLPKEFDSQKFIADTETSLTTTSNFVTEQIRAKFGTNADNVLAAIDKQAEMEGDTTPEYKTKLMFQKLSEAGVVSEQLEAKKIEFDVTFNKIRKIRDLRSQPADVISENPELFKGLWVASAFAGGEDRLAILDFISKGLTLDNSKTVYKDIVDKYANSIRQSIGLKEETQVSPGHIVTWLEKNDGKQSEVIKTLKKGMYADHILDEANNWVYKPKNNNSSKVLAGFMGENAAIDKLDIISKTDGKYRAFDKNGKDISREFKKTLTYLTERDSKMTFGNKYAGAKLVEGISNDRGVDKYYAEQIKSEFAKSEMGQSATISDNKDPNYIKLVNLASSQSPEGAGFAATTNSPITITHLGNDQWELSQMVADKKGDIRKTKKISGNTLRSNLPNATIDFAVKDNTFYPVNEKFTPNNQNKIKYIKNKTGMDISTVNLISQISNTTIPDPSKQTLIELTGKADNIYVETSFDDSELGSSNATIRFIYKNGKGDTKPVVLLEKEQPLDVYQDSRALLLTMPEIFLNEIIQDIIDKEAFSVNKNPANIKYSRLGLLSEKLNNGTK